MKASAAEMNDTEFYRWFVIGSLEHDLPRHAARHLRPTFEGDAERADNLAGSLPNELRGVVAVQLWNARIPRPAFRAYLAAAWMHDHLFVIGAAGSRRRLGAMFRYARFNLPADLPETVRLWRGTQDVSLSEALRGYSWTADRDTACWFAMRRAQNPRTSLVVAVDLPREHIAMFTDERGEKEAVLTKAPARAWVDGDAPDWAAGFARYEAAKQAEQRAWQSRMRSAQATEAHAHNS